jgi:DNA polymerase-1
MDMEFNLNSGPQMQEFLYNFLELKPPKAKNEKGNYSVAEEVLIHHAEKDDVEFCKMLLGMRKLRKAKNTYAKGIRRLLCEETNKFHTDYWLQSVRTYRSSATLIQTIPKHGDIIEGIPWAIIRKVFARKEMLKRIRCGDVTLNLQQGLIGEVDYVGAEVKVAAGITDDAQLIYDLNHGYDQHSHWAGVLFGIDKSVDEIKAIHKDERFLAKNNFTFANLFGAGNVSIAEEMRKHEVYINFIRTKFEIARQSNGFNSTWSQFFKDYSEEHISECQGVFYSRYPDVKGWQDYVVKKYYDVGYVETPFGFRRRYPLKRNEIINFPIQSSSFHLLLHSLIEIDRILTELDLQSCLVAQVHDSGFFNVMYREAEQVMDIVQREMTVKPFEWLEKVHLEAEWELGNDWYDLKLENKPFAAKHIKSGEVFKDKFLHGFARDMGMDIELLDKVLAGKKDKNDKPFKMKGWDIKYV